jgi:rSAM/selenodomain-associated transferase 1
MIKAPRTGSSKTRLCPPLEPHESAALSRCFFQDTVANVLFLERNGVAGAVVFTPVESEHEFRELLPNDFLLVPQRGESLEDRLHHAAEDLFRAGFESVCLLGSDSPTLPLSYLDRMVEYLYWSENGVVLGPTFDGGYYAIGLKSPCRRLFEGIDWSTDRVFVQTKARIEELALPLIILPAWYDVDDGPALQRLVDDITSSEDESAFYSANRASHTRAFLNSHFWHGRRQAKISREGAV